CIIVFFFFFSSRRRHTRSLRDWSSDVCSSDLSQPGQAAAAASWKFVALEYSVDWNTEERLNGFREPAWPGCDVASAICNPPNARSEERRVGKECGSWRERYRYRTK